MEQQDLKYPRHIGIIMDGNRRYARERGMKPWKGHYSALNVFRHLGKWCLKRGITMLTIWAFSTENWKRSQEEVGYLMALLKKVLKEEINKIHQEGIRVNVLGDVTKFDRDIQMGIRKVINLTKNNTKGVLNVALNYGGRWDILNAVKKIVAKKIPPSKITEKTFSKLLATGLMPDPDLIIRTSGEQRTSGFLIWQAAYSELYFCQKYFPDFTENDFQAALDEYSRRQRRFGE